MGRARFHLRIFALTPVIMAFGAVSAVVHSAWLYAGGFAAAALVTGLLAVKLLRLARPEE